MIINFPIPEMNLERSEDFQKSMNEEQAVMVCCIGVTKDDKTKICLSAEVPDFVHEQLLYDALAMLVRKRAGN